MANIKELTSRPERLTGGHRLCAGCGASIAVRQVLMASKYPVVIACATGCLEVSTTIYPYTAWNPSFIHSAFENSAATISGVESAYRALRRAGKLDQEYRFVGFGGDGGTYDIGLQALSGAAERGHKMVYVCYDNGAYMNTGIQRSSATPLGAWTSTTPVGSAQSGKGQVRKDLTSIMAAHNIPYVAQAAVSHWNDLVKKAEKAFEADGCAFLNILAPCPRGWRYPSSETIQMSKLAVQTGYWPLFEVEDGVWRITGKVKERKPIREYFEPQGRFKHLFKSGDEQALAVAQEWVDRQWQKLHAFAGEA